MANTITNVLPILFSAAKTVSRELVGFTRSVRTDFDDKKAGLNQTIRVPISPVQTTSAFVPSDTFGSGTDRTFTNIDVVITKTQKTTFNMTGEEDASLTAGGNRIAEETFQQSMEQSFRVLINEAEVDIANEFVKASRAFGTAGTTPFGSNFNEVAELRKILDDNGAPSANRSIVIDTAAGVNLRQNTILTKVNEAGGSENLRQGELLDIHGFKIKESDGVQAHTKGTENGAFLINGAEAIEQTTITVDTGTGTIIAGDIFTHATDSTNKYVVKTALTAGDLILQDPGLLIAAADNDAVTIGANYTANLAFHRDAIVFVARPPMITATPIIETELVTDEFSGMTFMVVRALQSGQVTWGVHLAWGFQTVNPKHVAILLG